MMESEFGDISRPRILIVEDQRVTAEKLRMDLEHLGYEVCGIVPKGEEVFQKAQDTRPDITLQGEVDGIEAAQGIRMRLNIPIVFLSAYSDQSVVERARIAEPYGYIVKPYRVEELHAVVEIALFKHKADIRIKETEQRLELALMGADLGLWDYNLKTGLFR
jgi:AmiR/NasT family two-component response regulator